MLERTPAPLGKPGGPGLYRVKGLGHTPYFEQVVKALIEKRGMPKDKAYRIAWGALRKWRRGGGNVHPEVRAAATGALAGEAAKGAQARASHGHANDAWEVADCLIELAVVAPPGSKPQPPPQRSRPQSNNWQNEPRVPKGQFGGGRFGSGGGQAKGKPQRRAVMQRRATAAKRAKLETDIARIRRQIAALRAMLPKTGKRSKSSTPAKKGAAAVSARQAAAAKQTAASSKSAAKTARAGTKRMSPATIHAKIAALRATLQADIAQLRVL